MLHMALMLLLTVGAVAGFFLYAAYNHGNTVRRCHDSDQCLLDAQSALEQVKYGLLQGYLSNQVSSAGSLDWFQTWAINKIGSNPIYNIPALAPINGSAVAVTIANVNIDSTNGYAEVQLIGAARRSAPYAVTRLIQETLRVDAGGGTNSIINQDLNYAYFIDNAGNLSGSMYINGDVRANGTFKLGNNKVYINGNRYASGKISGSSTSWSLANYQKTANTTFRARPTNPTGVKKIAWPMGYAGTVTKFQNTSVLPMPTIDNIDALAASVNGRIIQNGVNVAVNSYAGPGPDGIAGTADDNCLVLNGLSAPITIQGAVVVKGDLIIRGKVSGQGTIYAGRNVHIVGDLSYVNPPAWPKNDSNPDQTAANNANKDILVLAAKGNVVVGNYTTSTWSNRVWNIMTASAGSYSVSASDAAIGYDSDNKPANGYLFDGRYYANEANNGQRLSGVGTKTVPRKYYESSLAYSTFNGLCSADVPSIDAALFSNHGIIGNWGQTTGNTVLNGTMACHDDLKSFYGSFTINWDIRLGSQSNDRVNTFFMSTSGGTGGVASASTIGWREIH